MFLRECVFFSHVVMNGKCSGHMIYKVLFFQEAGWRMDYFYRSISILFFSCVRKYKLHTNYPEQWTLESWLFSGIRSRRDNDAIILSV